LELLTRVLTGVRRHFFGRIRAQQVGYVVLLAIEPARRIVGRNDERHAIVDRRRQLVGRTVSTVKLDSASSRP
jgi:hypothetical protein